MNVLDKPTVDLLKIYEAIGKVGNQVATLQANMGHHVQGLEGHDKRLGRVEDRVQLLEKDHSETQSLLLRMSKNVTVLVEDVESLVTRGRRQSFIVGGAGKILMWIGGTVTALILMLASAYFISKWGLAYNG